MDLLDVAGGISPKQRHDPQTGFKGLVEANGRLQRATVGKAGEAALFALAHAYWSFARERPGLYAASLRAALPGEKDVAAAGTVIENAAVNELPLNGRQYLNLVALAPNVNVLSPAAGQAGARLGGERAAQSISAGGQRIFFNYYTLDGVNNTDPNFQNYIALPSIDAGAPRRRPARSRRPRSRRP